MRRSTCARAWSATEPSGGSSRRRSFRSRPRSTGAAFVSGVPARTRGAARLVRRARAGSERRLGQVVTLEVAGHQRAPARCGARRDPRRGGGRPCPERGRVIVPRRNSAAGDPGRGAGASRGDRSAQAQLEVGELLLAPGVPFSLDAGGFGRHTFLWAGRAPARRTRSASCSSGCCSTPTCRSSCSTRTPTSCGSGSCGPTRTRPKRISTRRRPARSLCGGPARDSRSCSRSSSRRRRLPCSASTRWPTVRSTPSSSRSPKAASRCPSSDSRRSRGEARPAGG